MGTPITPPRILADARGRTRLKLKRGRGAHDDPNGPHAHYFSVAGTRCDQSGRLVEARARGNFRAVRWDLPEAAPSLPSGPPDLSVALTLARRSATFRAELDNVLRSGWVIELAAPGFGAGCRKGPNTISLDTSTRGGFVARMVRDVAYANALAEPLPVLDAKAPGFLREDSLFLMRKWGQAMLCLAIVRDEILAAGGPDIGGPGLRGLQHEAYDQHRRQGIPLARTIDAIAFSIDGALAAGFSPFGGPRVGRNLEQAFVAPPVIVASSMSAEMLQVLERVRLLPTIDEHTIGRVFEVELAPRPLAVETPYLQVRAALLDHGPFSWVELREPAPGASHLVPRVLLTPRFQMSQFDLGSWFGLGVAHGVDPLDAPTATAAYAAEHREMYVTYAAEDARVVTFFTLAGR
jgi:hypothetical protein